MHFHDLNIVQKIKTMRKEKKQQLSEASLCNFWNRVQKGSNDPTKS